MLSNSTFLHIYPLVKARFPNTFFAAYRLVCLIALLPITANSQIFTPAQWEDAFLQTYNGEEPMLDIVDANESGRLAWEASYWLRCYISMAQAFKDTVYLDRAERLIDFLLVNRDDTRFARGELDLLDDPYYSAPLFYLNHREQAAPGWRRWDGFYSGWRILLIDDAMITSAIMRYIDLIYENQAFSQYQEKAAHFLEKVQETVNAHESSFVFERFNGVPGSYYFPDPSGSGLQAGAVPLNMNAAMGVTLLLIDKVRGGNDAYRQMAIAILEYFKLYARVTENNAYDWDYHPQNPGIGATMSGVEDFNHAHIDIGFFYLAYKRGMTFTKVHMQRFANTLTQHVFLGEGELAWSVDGAERGDDKNYWPVAFDWIDLAEFDAEVLVIAKAVYQKHYAKPGWARAFLGWAEILRWMFVEQTTAVLEQFPQALPTEIALEQNYPNPFNPSTTIAFNLQKPGHVSLKIFNLLGEEVADLADTALAAGQHSYVWDASDFESGIYFYRLRVGLSQRQKTLLLLK